MFKLSCITLVTAGAEVIASVGAWWTSTDSQSFVFNTSLRTP
jgi:hypothetical protein